MVVQAANHPLNRSRLLRSFSMMLEPGLEPIPGYTLSQPLGNGAFGDVWEAVTRDQGEVALKFLDCRKRSSAMVASEVRILRSLAALDHPHIIRLLGVHTWGRYVILCMERADSNLEDLRLLYRTRANSEVSRSHALDLLGQAAQALDFIANLKLSGMTGSRGMQHCDIKPTNLLLCGTTLKVADFGLCAGTGWQTHSGGWRGTLPFAAPELFNGAATVGTDQYALAITYCWLVMGETVFFPLETHRPGERPVDLTKMRTEECPVLARALHPYPSSRYPSCQAFIDALRQARNKPTSGVRPSLRRSSGLIRRSGILRALQRTP
jgi:serine/threonine protein kinase